MDEATLPEGETFARRSEVSATEYHVVNALRRLGHTVGLLGVGARLEPVVVGLLRQKPDVVFNLTEQFRDLRMLDANVAGLLELLDLPFTGSGPAGLMLCRDKGLAKHVLRAGGVMVPRFEVVEPGIPSRTTMDLAFPLVVKPLLEDGSEGISNASLVHTRAELIARVRAIHRRFRQAAIIEEYVTGRELYVTVLGNGRLTVLPPREIEFTATGGAAPLMATYQVKWDKRYRKRWRVRQSFARLEPGLLTSIAKTCRDAFRLLHVRDYARVDLRVTPEGRVVVLEVNPNPGLNVIDEVALSAEKAGIPYQALIDRIVRMAIARHRAKR